MVKIKKINIFVLTILSLIICINTVFANDGSYYINNNNVSMTKEAYDNLISLGFTISEIENMSKDEYDLNCSVRGNVVSSIVEFYKTVTEYDDNYNLLNNTSEEITKDEFVNSNKSIITRNYNGYVETNYKKMTTQIIQLQNSYRYKVSLEWKTMPSTRSYDIIGIGMNSNFVIDSLLVFQQTYCLKNGTCESTNNGITKKTSTGGAVLFKLPSSTSINSLNSYLYFNISKNTSSLVEEMYAYGDYAHSVAVVNNISSSDYTINTSGISLSSNFTTKFDEISVAKAYWQGSW